MLQLLNF